MKVILIVISLICFGQIVDAQIGRLALSPVQKIEQVVGSTDVSIVYSRPSMRGRTIFGDLVPYGEPWRTGANRNTTIEFSEDVIIGTKRVKKGKYAIFTIPTTDSWEVIFYSDTDNWNVPETIEDDKIVALIEVNSYELSNTLENFTINIGAFTNYNFDLHIAWSNTGITIPIQTIAREIMEKKISRILTGPSHVDYYAAAVYEMESGHNFAKGLEHINKAIDMIDVVSFWELRIKAILLEELERNEEAKKIANQGMSKAKEVQSEYGISEFTKILKKLE